MMVPRKCVDLYQVSRTNFIHPFILPEYGKTVKKKTPKKEKKKSPEITSTTVMKKKKNLPVKIERR